MSNSIIFTQRKSFFFHFFAELFVKKWQIFKEKRESLKLSDFFKFSDFNSLRFDFLSYYYLFLSHKNKAAEQYSSKLRQNTSVFRRRIQWDSHKSTLAHFLSSRLLHAILQHYQHQDSWRLKYDASLLKAACLCTCQKWQLTFFDSALNSSMKETSLDWVEEY